MRIVTWNINSVRLRLDMVLRLVDDYGPDVLCLQETKVIDDAFPLKALADRGYVHAHVRGMKSYNGVAILSRLPLSGTGGTLWCERQDCRHVQAELPGGIELHNFYIPAGGDIPDPDLNDKFRHKLRFLDELAAWGEALEDRAKPRILVGDLNIAPLENDVWSHRALLNVISHTPIEVEKMEAMRRAGDWVDAVRHFLPASEKLYTCGPTAPPTGACPTGAAPWTTSGSPRRWCRACWATPYCARRAAGGRSRPTTCR
nr:exodeoxyribonuclease III [Azospirillum sp. B4]